MLHVIGGGGGGAAPIPGLAGDGQTPGGITVAGAATIGSSTSSGHSFSTYDPVTGALLLDMLSNGSLTAGVLDQQSVHQLNGTAAITAPNTDYGNDTLDINQVSPLAANSSANALWINRNGALNGHQYTDAALRVEDNTASTADLFKTVKANVIGVRINGAGAVGVFGHTAPAAQAVLATGAGATVDDVITLLQSYGLCKQA